MKKILFFDWWLILPAFFLSIFSILLLATLSGENYLAIYQALFLFIGLIFFCIFVRLHYLFLFSIWFYLYLVGIFFLGLVLILGQTKFGAARWISLGFFNFQPSELFKIILPVGLIAFLLERPQIKIKDYFLYLLLLILPIFLVAKEPDLGTALMYLALGFLIYFFSGRARKFFYGTMLILILVLPLFFQFGLKPYQKERIKTFLNPKQDILGSGYNVWQSMIAVGSGGLWGKGLGRGTQSQSQFLPVRYADFIYATAAEAIGFIGSMVIFGLYFVLLFRIFWTAYTVEEQRGALLSLSFGLIFLIQILVNIGMNLGVMPITGLPLVFFSHGGSSLISSFIILGIINNIVRRAKKFTFQET